MERQEGESLRNSGHESADEESAGERQLFLGRLLLLEFEASMFRQILVPVNLTEADLAAVAAARDLAAQSGGSVTLLHVIETIRDVPFEDLEDFYQRLEEKARREMQELSEPLSAAGVEVEQGIVYGRRAREIVAFAEQREIDLIVLTSRRPDPGNMQEIWGNISHQVAILSTCPVLLIK